MKSTVMKFAYGENPLYVIFSNLALVKFRTSGIRIKRGPVISREVSEAGRSVINLYVHLASFTSCFLLPPFTATTALWSKPELNTRKN